MSLASFSNNNFPRCFRTLFLHFAPRLLTPFLLAAAFMTHAPSSTLAQGGPPQTTAPVVKTIKQSAPAAPSALSSAIVIKPDFSPGSAFGTRGEIPGAFRYPVGLAFDSSGKLWVADWGNQRVQILSLDGKPGKSLDADLDGPCAVAIDSKGYVYISEIRNNRVAKFDKNGEFIEHIGGYGRQEGKFKEPRGIAVDTEDNVYVADTRNDRIQKFDRNGKFLFKILYRDKRARYESPRWVAKDVAGSGIYAVYPGIHKVIRFDSDGNWVTEFGAKGDQPGFFNEPRSVGTDYRGMVYVSDYGNNRVQMFEPGGKFAEVMGIASQKGKKMPGALSSPESVAFDRFGNLYVADAGNDRIQCFNLKSELLYRNQAESFQAAGDRAAAMNAYLKLHEVSPEDPGASKYLKRALLSDAAESEESREWEKAIEIYMKMADLGLMDKENQAQELKKISFLRYRWIYYSLAGSLALFLLVAAIIVRLGPGGKTPEQ